MLISRDEVLAVNAVDGKVTVVKIVLNLKFPLLKLLPKRNILAKCEQTCVSPGLAFSILFLNT